MIRLTFVRAVSSAAALALVSTLSFADDTSVMIPEETETQNEQAGQASKDMNLQKIRQSSVLNQIHHLNQKEIELAKMAQEKGQSKEVKDLASRILQDHQKADQRVQDFAKKQNIQLSDYQPAGYEKQLTEQLRGMNSTEFDRVFSELQHMSHMQHVQQYQAMQDNLKDEQLKQFVKNDFLPALKQHKEMSSNMEMNKEKKTG